MLPSNEWRERVSIGERVRDDAQGDLQPLSPLPYSHCCELLACLIRNGDIIIATPQRAVRSSPGTTVARFARHVAPKPDPNRYLDIVLGCTVHCRSR
jgi:hypothetical protein